MAVQPRRGTVGGPASVGNTGMRIKDLGHVGLLLVDQSLELGDLANLLEGQDGVLLVAIDSETGRIISTVLEA